MNNFYTLEVLNVIELTKDSKQIDFKIPKENIGDFNFKPGQYITLKFNIQGNEYRRAYSVCSSVNALSTVLSVGVKRVKKGVVSNYINDTLVKGSKVEVMAPIGDFYAKVEKDQYKTYYLFAAGSGITPMLSILKTVLETEEKSYINLLYGNSNLDSIMFKDELEKLKSNFSDRLNIDYYLSKPKSKWNKLWKSSKKDSFNFTKGRIDEKAIKNFIKTNAPYAQNSEYYTCGPNEMMRVVENSLVSIDVPKERIFKESFGGPKSTKNTESKGAILNVKYKNKEQQIEIKEGRTILSSLIKNKIDISYSCEGGVCGMCKAKLVEGNVEMDSNMFFTDEEVEEKNILCCQSRPISSEVSIEIEDI